MVVRPPPKALVRANPLQVGQWRWVACSEEAYYCAKVLNISGLDVTVQRESGKQERVHENALAEEYRDDPAHLQETLPDLVKMHNVSRPHIVDMLRRRYMADEIYTNIADILVAINPYKRLPLYTPEIIDTYATCSPSSFDELPPHVFKIAAAAYNRLMDTRQPQAMLIPGESGAGKTETTKLALGLLTHAASLRGATTDVAGKLMGANPLLEALGNAKTVRNNNSSRFGKFVSINYSAKGSIESSTVHSYLLEKSRVIAPNPGERNYHIFYQMCAGAAGVYPELRLKEEPSMYYYLRMGGSVEVEGMDDAAEFKDVLKSLKVLEFTDAEALQCFRIFAAVCHLGNVRFDDDDDAGGGGGSHVRMGEAPKPAEAAAPAGGARRRRSTVSQVVGSAQALAAASSLLGIDGESLAEALTHSVTTMRGERITKNLSASAAMDTRDALAKHLYSQTFDWVVARVNRSLDPGGKSHPLEIGILDIFGFEIFEKNLFEQLCINFTNEKLHSHFTKHTFEMEETLYRTEGIDIPKIDYYDNTELLVLVEGKRESVFSILNDEVKVGARGSDDAYFKKFIKAKGGHDRVVHKPMWKDSFQIRHFAGDVTYVVTGFLEKNRDRLLPSLAEAVGSSSEPFVSAMVADADPSAKPKTLTQRFCGQLNQLMADLGRMWPHYVKCIKPNAIKTARVFQGQMTLDQLSGTGVFDAVTIRQSGYPFREKHQRFVIKFWLFAKKSFDAAEIHHLPDYKAAARTLIDALAADPEYAQLAHCKIGNTLVFWRTDEDLLLSKARRLIEGRSVLDIQCSARQGIARRLRAKLAHVRALRLACEKSMDLDQVEAALPAAAAVPFKGYDAFRLEWLKRKIVRTRELEDALVKLQDVPILEIDAHYKQVCKEAGEFEHDSVAYRKCQEKYKVVVFLEAQLDAVDAAVASDDPAEAALKAALKELATLQEKYGAGMAGARDNSKAGAALLAHLEAEIGLCRALAVTVAAAADAVGSDFTLHDLEASAEDVPAALQALEAHGCKKLESREVVAAGRLYARVVEATVTGAKVVAAQDTLAVLDGPKKGDVAKTVAKALAAAWAGLDAALKEEEDTLDMTHNAPVRAAIVGATAKVRAAAASLSEGTTVLEKSLRTTTIPLLATLDEALAAAGAVNAAHGGWAPLTQEVARVKALRARVEAENAVMDVLQASLESEKLVGPVESLFPGTKLSVAKLKAAIEGAEDHDFLLPDNASAYRAAKVLMVLRERVIGVVLFHKRWRRSVGEGFMQADATLKGLNDHLSKAYSMPTSELKPEARTEVELAHAVAAKFSVVDEVVARLEVATQADDMQRLTYGLYQADALDVEAGFDEVDVDDFEAEAEARQQAKVVRDARARLEVIEPLVRELDEALKAPNVQVLEGVVSRGNAVRLRNDRLPRAVELLAKAKDVVLRAAVAVGSLDRRGLMRGVAGAAAELHFENDDLKLIRSRLLMPEDQFLRTMLDVAVCDRDLGMASKVKARLIEIAFTKKNAQTRYALSRAPGVRSAAEYVGRRFNDPAPLLRQRNRMKGMLKWVGDDLPSPLTNLPTADVRSLALLQFKNIQAYMGDRPAFYKDVLCDEVARMAMETPEVIDETYCQILKQLTANPRPESLALGWHLLEHILHKFAPSADLVPYVQAHIFFEDRQEMLQPLLHTIFSKEMGIGGEAKIPAGTAGGAAAAAAAGGAAEGAASTDAPPSPAPTGAAAAAAGAPATPPPAPAPRPVFSSPASPGGSVPKQGYLAKRSGNSVTSRTLKRRFFKISHSTRTLTYYQTDACEQRMGVVKLANVVTVYAVAAEDDEARRSYPFVIDTSGGRALVLSACSEDDRRLWLDALEKARERASDTPASATKKPPPKWESAQDSNRRTFYYCRATGARQWTKPAEFGK